MNTARYIPSQNGPAVT